MITVAFLNPYDTLPEQDENLEMGERSIDPL